MTDIKAKKAKQVIVKHTLLHQARKSEDEGWDFPPDMVMPQLLKSLKKGGKLLIIDHQASEGTGKSLTKSLHRMEGNFVKQDIINRDFTFVKESSLLKNDEDPLDISVFSPQVRRKADRFVYLFEKK